MITGEMEKLYPSAKALVKECVASRLHAKDASLYDFSEEARACAEAFMGWTDLASMPPFPIEKVQAFADAAVEGGVDTVVLVGQGGSTQAPMTITRTASRSRRWTPTLPCACASFWPRSTRRTRSCSCHRRAAPPSSRAFCFRRCATRFAPPCRKERCVGIWWPSPTRVPTWRGRPRKKDGPPCFPASRRSEGVIRRSRSSGFYLRHSPASTWIRSWPMPPRRRRGAARTPSTTRRWA